MVKEKEENLTPEFMRLPIVPKSTHSVVYVRPQAVASFAPFIEPNTNQPGGLARYLVITAGGNEHAVLMTLEEFAAEYERAKDYAIGIELKHKKFQREMHGIRD